MRIQQAIDWADVHARLARAAAATHRSAEDERRILCRRAALAIPAASAGPATTVPVLDFSLGGVPHAIETRWLREIVRLADLTPVPGTSDILLGLVPVRGEVVAVFDLRRLLGLAPGGPPPTRLLVVGDDAVELAIAVTAAGAVAPLDLAALRDPPVAGPLVRGVTADLVLIDGRALLSDPRTTLDEA